MACHRHHVAGVRCCTRLIRTRSALFVQWASICFYQSLTYPICGHTTYVHATRLHCHRRVPVMVRSAYENTLLQRVSINSAKKYFRYTLRTITGTRRWQCRRVVCSVYICSVSAARVYRWQKQMEAHWTNSALRVRIKVVQHTQCSNMTSMSRQETLIRAMPGHRIHLALKKLKVTLTLTQENNTLGLGE